MEGVNERIRYQEEEESTFLNLSSSITGANTQFAMSANYFEINIVNALVTRRKYIQCPGVQLQMPEQTHMK